MNVLFEDDGQLKAGAVLADQDTSLQVEVSTGRRVKVKAANVLMRFASPGPAEALAPTTILEAALRTWGMPERQIYRLAAGGHYPLLPNEDGLGWCARNADELAAIIDASSELTRQPLSIESSSG